MFVICCCFTDNMSVSFNTGLVRKELKRLKITFNEDAVVLLTKTHVPVYVKFIASLGRNFNYCLPVNRDAVINTRISMDKIMNLCDNFEDIFILKHEFRNIERSIADRTISDHPTEAQEYIRNLATLTSAYMKGDGRDIVIIQADKGGKTVIMDRIVYQRKVREHIDGNIILGNYATVEQDFMSRIRPIIESRYQEIITEINPFLIADGTIREPLRAESFLLPLFYGCPKIHKPSVPLRPIISSCNMIGDVLSDWLLSKLNVIAKYIGTYSIHSACRVKNDLGSFKLEESHVLCSLDYESMFTNIDVDQAAAVVAEFYHLIQVETCVPCSTFLKCIRFYTKDSAYFSALNVVYNQCKGLAMGNKLSQSLAEIRSSYALLKSLSRYDASTISFLYKYVDDIFSAIHLDMLQDISDAIAADAGMKLSIEYENEQTEVNFLDATFTRNPDATVSARWYQKDCAALQTMNYHSYHPRHMKRNVTSHMVSSAFSRTSPEYMPMTEELLRRILHNSSYPSPFVDELIGLYHSIQQPRPLNEPKMISTYISCPFYDPMIKKINAVISERSLPIKIAPSPFAKNRRVIFSRIKDKRPIYTQKNSLFRVRCQNCAFSCELISTNLDMMRTLHRLADKKGSKIYEHVNEFPGHEINQKVEILFIFKNAWDARKAIGDEKRISDIVSKWSM